MAQMPRVANIQCSRLKFQPGDRILVKSFHRLDADQQRRLKRSICKWAGCEVEVLIICTADMDIEIDRRVIQL
jgi:hypothetical protein